MKFRTQLSLPPSVQKIDYQSPIMGIGSCFIENIGTLLTQYKFPTCLNPFGILYNPVSINHTLQRLLQPQLYTPKDLIENREIWYSFDHHGAFSSTEAATTIALINQSYQTAISFFNTTKWLFLTFGTATIYRYKSSKKIVANCHKIPNQQFEKERLTITQIVDALSITLERLFQKNPSVNILLTVSPVRHIKDGIVENQRSKSILLLATEQLVQSFPQVHYFPAYELVMDDLRDYRFFEKDLVHPNQMAIAYIWQVFISTYCSETTKQLMKSVQKIVQASQHRPFHTQSTEHQHFVQKQLEKIEHLETQYSFLSFERERELLLKNSK